MKNTMGPLGEWYKLADMNSVFDFGRHEGESIMDVLNSVDASYVRWCMERLPRPIFAVTKELQDYITEKFGITWNPGIEDEFQAQRELFDSCGETKISS